MNGLSAYGALCGRLNSEAKPSKRYGSLIVDPFGNTNSPTPTSSHQSR